MILADKIITLRKKNGWSQEELAEKLNVTRQSVSKWEGAQSVPDLNKILLMSRIFEVSTDFLLKDEMEESCGSGAQEIDSLQAGVQAGAGTEESVPVRKVSMAEARAFLEVGEKTAGTIALAVFLCITSPICLLLLSSAQETGRIAVSENVSAGIGMVILLLLIASAVALFIFCDMKTKQYEYMNEAKIETEYGVTGMVNERKKDFQDTYTRCNIIGTCCCILAVIPLFAVMIFTEDDFMMVLAVCVLLLIVAVGVYFFIIVGVRWDSMQKLLQEGDYTVDNKRGEAAFRPVCCAYWMVVTAAYLGYSLYTKEWQVSWIIWPVAGVLFAAVKSIFMAAVKRRK